MDTADPDTGTRNQISLAHAVPKAELHVHIEGTLEPELMFSLAGRNHVELPYKDVAAVRAAYEFDDLQSFLDLYYQGAAVLQEEHDFSDLMFAYLERAERDNVRRAEIFFDPQTHTQRGVPLEVVLDGLLDGIKRAADLAVDAELILCFLRHLSEDEALETLEKALANRERILGVGLDSSEVGHPPEKFARVYALAREAGLRLTAHAGEEGPPEYVWGAIDTLGVERIDHGVRSVEDTALIERLAAEQIPLTVCPLSNRKLKVTPELANHPLPAMIAAGLLVSINSDDPSYFGGYIARNYEQSAAAMGLSQTALADVARSSFRSAFLPDAKKQELIAEVDSVVASLGSATA